MDNTDKYSILVCINPESANGLLYSILHYPDYSVETAETISECLEKVNSEQFSALIIDSCFFKKQNKVDIPIISKITMRLPVIVIAEKEEIESENSIREQKIFYYLPKPVIHKELIEVIRQATNWSTFRRNRDKHGQRK